MKEQDSDWFYGQLHQRMNYAPLIGQIELTYRCGLDCVHCYCKGSQGPDRELSTVEWEKILDTIHSEGCIWLTLTGGDPLTREDFLELYSYAKAKGFIITVFTNSQQVDERIIDFWEKFPPYSVEITLNGITKKTYEAITRVPGSFGKAMRGIKMLAGKKLPLILKANCLKQNKNEIARIKEFAGALLERPPAGGYYFKYDPMIYPRLNGDKTPVDFRLSFDELLELRKQDPDIWGEYKRSLHCDLPGLPRDENFLYHCSSWAKRFFIDPFGRIKFCMFSEKFSADLKDVSFKDAFYKWHSQILAEKFKTNSKCINCRLRPVCYRCPARAYLETGDEEAPVEYYCRLAEGLAEEKEARCLESQN